MTKWTTPEEIARKRDRNKKFMYFSIPIIGAILGVMISLLFM